ncbi:DUF3267 domain-containing protein [Bacillus mangrovi]|uniref:DUF3267 domain-containing protein n=1 Tax=Metabacillus mangrovi TaxID=1491830 RepID=A0A7X2V627_9BACI|nr:DUF3267 domain-containing protein [Metabacillus mangrovi]MTH54794.1 DUF3267 domain-containing protein [Metabacillus mangrovi]
MKIVFKFPKGSSSKHELLFKEGWIPLKEPVTLSSAILQSFPFMFLTTLLTFLVISLFSPFTLEDFGLGEEGFTFTIHFEAIFYVLVIIIVHELIHLIFIPRFFSSERTYLGFTFFGGFVYTEEVISKHRFLLITAAPYLILSIILPVLAGIFGLFNTQMKIVLLIHSLASSVDALVFLLAASQVPADGQLISNGMKTFWRCRDAIEK